MEPITVPRHLVVSAGRVSPKIDSAIKDHTPKQIQYKHTIRVITPFSCSHEDEIKQIREESEATIKQKQREIDQLRLQLKEKTDELEKKNQEIERLRQNAKKEYSMMKTSIMENKLERSQVTDIFYSNVKSQIDHGCFSNIKTSFIFDLTSNQNQQSKQLNKLQEEFQNMQNNLKSLANTLAKPKKAYQFFTRPKQQAELMLPQKIQKLQTKPDIIFQDFLQEEENFDEEDESLDHTSTNQSFDATDFLQQAIHEHQILRDTLIELEQSTKTEMQHMKQFYQNQIEVYKRMLQQQRNKNKSIDGIILREIQKGQLRRRQKEFADLLRGEIEKIDDPSSPFDND